MADATVKKKFSILSAIEKIGNKIPHPFILFFYLCIVIILLSWICSLIGMQAVNPNTKEAVVIKSLLSVEGIQWMMENMVKNFIGFAPLGIVIVITLGTGLAEEAGFFFTFLKRIMTGVPPCLLSGAVVFCGISGNIASDAAYVFLPPVSALVFLSVGRHPIAGLAAGYAGIAGGFTANLLITPQDANLAGITNEILKNIDPSLFITPAANWYFLIASTVMLTVLGTFITDRIVEPRLGKYQGEEEVDSSPVTELQKKALRNAGLAALVFVIVLLICVVPDNGLLRTAGKDIMRSPFMKALIPIMFLFFLVIAVAYGKTAGTIKTAADIPRMMIKSMSGLSGFVVLCFMIAQFVSFFNWTNLGTAIAFAGADLLIAAGLTGIPCIIGVILISTIINLFIGSGQAKWSLLSPIFLPMLMTMGYSPAFIQMLYRIGDSSTNTISPLLPYIAIIIATAQKYKKDSGMGTVISLMLPYAMLFLVFWIILLIVWMELGLPLGPGAPVYLQ